MFRVVNQTLEESSNSRLKGRESERFTRKQFQIFLQRKAAKHFRN
jgi:hypothetical protein